MVGLECPHQLVVSPPLNLHSQNDKRMSHSWMSPQPPKILGHKANSNG